MNVLIIEPMKKPYMKSIDSDLKSLQHEVGGYIEAIYPFEEKVGLVCNEEGKMDGLPLNRAIYGENGEMIDIIAGTFMIVGLRDDSFESLPDELVQKFSKLFETPEEFYSVNGEVHVEKAGLLPDKSEPTQTLPEESKVMKDSTNDMNKGESRAKKYPHRAEQER